MAGDGWWDRKDYAYYARTAEGASRHIHIADNHGANAERLGRFVNSIVAERTPGATAKYFMVEQKKDDDPSRYGDTKKHTFGWPGSRAICIFLSEHLGGERDVTTAGSGNKHLPAFAYTAPRDFRIGMLCGLMDTDGSVSVSKANDRTQLMCSFSSTSLRLVRDTQLLARTLGIRSTITATKSTIADTDCWVLTFSAVDCKRTNVFAGLANAHKRDAFVYTPVDCAHAVYDCVVMPAHIGRIFMDYLYTPKVRTCDAEKRQFASYMAVRTAMQHGHVITRTALTKLCTALIEARDIRMCKATEARKLFRMLVNTRAVLTDELRTEILAGMTVLAPSTGDPQHYKELLTRSARLRTWAKKGNQAGKLENDTLDWFEALPPVPCGMDDPAIVAYLDFVADTRITWSPIAAVERTGRREDGYDLTVPGYETFMATDGTILSNTVNFHVPASDRAVDQAYQKMLPSKNLFSLTDLKSPRHTPQQEMALGLYMLTRKQTGKPPKTYATVGQAKRAYHAGEIDANDPIEILELQ
jgi:hypothetical protein